MEITKDTNIEKDTEKFSDLDKKYQYLFDNAPCAIVIFDLKGNVIDFNSTLTKLLGYEKKAYLGKNFLEVNIFKPEMIPFLKKRLCYYVSGKKPEPIELEVYKKDGSLIWLNPSVSLVKLQNETVIEIIFQDISDKIKAKEQLKESERKYSRAFNRATFYKDLFTHDINNILNIINSSIELHEIFSNKPDKKHEIEEIYDIVKKQISRMIKLVSNIRQLSQLEDSDATLSRIEVKKVLKEAIDFVYKSFKTKQLNIQVDSIRGNFYVNANNLLYDVFENLLINAIKHNESSVIEILIKISKAKKDGINYLKLEFIDNGIGIPDDKKESIFQAKKIDTINNKGGLGFGLSLAKQIIENYNGSIIVEDKIKGDHSKGSNFILHFPQTN